MKRKWQNAFFVFGVVALAFMATQIDVDEARQGLRHAGLRFPAVMGLWVLLYALNTAAWLIIINASGRTQVRFPWLYKVTVSGFALNYATPIGLMGGEPYRIMELSPRIGMERASSSVILYVMTHIFSHFCFWGLSIVAFLLTESVSVLVGAVLAAAAAFCALGFWLFIGAYRKGIVVRASHLFGRIPLLGRWLLPMVERHIDTLQTIDRQTAALHKQSKSTLVAAVLIELACRVLSAMEIYLVITLVVPTATYLQCVLILAFTSLFANLLFFMPLQIGGREGGFLMSAVVLGMGAGAGVFTALIVRLRELVWTGIGLLLIKWSAGGGAQRR